MVNIMILLEFLSITLISIILMVIGALGIILLIKPLDKIIIFSVMEAGFFLAVVSFGYLDVALVIALFAPISVVTFLLSFIKINDIRKRNKNNEKGELFD